MTVYDLHDDALAAEAERRWRENEARQAAAPRRTTWQTRMLNLAIWLVAAASVAALLHTIMPDPPLAVVFVALGVACALLVRSFNGFILGGVFAPLALAFILLLVPPERVPYLDVLVATFGPLLNPPQRQVVTTAPPGGGITRQEPPAAVPVPASETTRAGWPIAPPAPQAQPAPAPAPPAGVLPTAHILPPPPMPAAVTVVVAPRAYTHPETGAVYAPPTAFPTMPPYQEPTAIPADAVPAYALYTRPDGATCVVVGDVRACDVRGWIDEQTQRWYAGEIAAGRLGEPHMVEAARPLPPVCKRIVVVRDDVPIGEVTECGATEAEADARAQAAADALRGGQP